MKKPVVVLGSILALLLSACLPIFTSTPGPGPTVDSAGTSDALFKTAVVETLTAQPTLASAPVTNTAVVSVDSPTLPPTLPPTATQAFTPSSNLTTTPVTATGVAAGTTPTATLAAGQVTAIWTLAIRKYGTLPPAVPFTRVTLVNKAKAEAYISLQVTMNDGKYSIIEYPVEGTIRIDAPVGSYLYVAWVGGNKMVGSFRLHQAEEMSIILYKDRVVLK